jgi:hypothetical protein
VVITRTRPSWDATPSIALRRPERDIPFFFSSSDASLAFLSALARSATLKLSEVAAVLLAADLLVCDAEEASFSASVRIKPAVSMSSSKTTQRRGREVKSWPRSSSVNVGSRRLIT